MSRKIRLPVKLLQWLQNMLSSPWSWEQMLTTYQTLHDYRFSFAAANWSTAVFDEAQNINNPNAQQTLAAKALKALFRIAMTGTPVENHLSDFWCILDAAEPGPLRSFVDFRQRWIAPMNRERERMMEIGGELRKHVGGFMLRRLKADALPGLPKKTEEAFRCPMSADQQALYEAARNAVAEDTGGGIGQGHHLAALWHLRQISLHPYLVGGGSIPVGSNPSECRSILIRSGKLEWLLEQLEAIRTKKEKVLIFCVLKQLQEALSRHLQIIFGFTVPIINGDTNVSSARKPDSTRLGLIAEFSGRSGFAICILSPIAAGAGLNIVAANHVIHLERHWNPAKEDQATDRVHRMGQDNPVTVYLPSAIHPNFPSFDQILHQLIDKKRSLQGALGLIPPESVTGPELMADVFPNARAQTEAPAGQPLSMEAALSLSWKLFEGLIALIYEREADRVILTHHGIEHGADVAVLGWGPGKTNLLIQCKTTMQECLDADEGIQSVKASQPFVEKPLGAKFQERVFHTTARKFSSKCQQTAEMCEVSLQGRDWLKAALQKHQPSMVEVFTRAGRREHLPKGGFAGT